MHTLSAHSAAGRGVHIDSGTAVVTVRGELDIESLPVNQALVDGALESEPRLLVLDLRDLTFLDSAGLTLLVRTNRRVRNADGTLAIANASSLVAAVIDRMDLGAMMRIVREPLDVEGVRALR